MNVTTTKIEGHTVLVYRYEAGKYLKLKFHLLSEVGAPWQAAAKAQLAAICAETKCKVVQVELQAAPWYVDALVPEAP
jgi:hypothetical protein